MAEPRTEVSAENEALLRERFASLSRLIPILYTTIFLDALLLAWLFRGLVPLWEHALLTAGILAAITTRSIYWIRRRGKANELDLEQIRRALRGTAIVGPLMSLVFSTIGFFLIQQATDPAQKAITLMSIWIVASASSFCVFSLPVTAILILLAAAAPLCLSIVVTGDAQLLAEAPAYVAVSVLMIYVLRENQRTFNELVRSRNQLRRLQEELGQSHKHLTLAQRVGGIGSAEIDLRSGKVMWSDHLFTLLNLDPARVAPSLVAFVDAVHPDDRDRVRSAVTHTQSSAPAAPLEFRVLTAGGAVRWLAWASDLRLSSLGAPEGVIMTVHDITERKRVELDLVHREAQLRLSNQHLDRAQKLGKVGSNEFDPATGEAWWSDELYAILGLDPAKVKPDASEFLARIHPDDAEFLRGRLRARARGESVEPAEYRIVQPNGEIRWVYGQSEVVRDAQGRVLKVTGTLHDITERKRTEVQLAHAQKMEAVGHLTGGVAHDFNNLFAVILGRLQMLDEELADRAELRSWVRSSLKAVERGATLTKSLLAFSRQQTLTPLELDLNVVVDDIEDLLRRTLGEAYEFQVNKASGLWTVEVDPGQLQNALLNLVLNARDAMPKGGRLTVDTRNVTQPAGHESVTPGDYVVMSVIDTGTGMSREVAERAFEPFFTTKDVDKGSGLGLSMVYGFVKQSGGHVTIDSTPGKGTAVRIYLPRKAEARNAAAAKSMPPRARPRGTETILVVEDNDDLRRLTRLQLQRLGYTVLDAGLGAEGLRLVAENPDIELMLTDVVMPQGMSGPDLAEQALALAPSLKVIFMSGYSEHRDIQAATRGLRFPLLQKPFHVDELATQIRAELDRGAEAANARAGGLP